MTEGSPAVHDIEDLGLANKKTVFFGRFKKSCTFAQLLVYAGDKTYRKMKRCALILWSEIW